MSKSNETTPNVPTLRFGGFSDLWKKSTIEKNAKVYDGTHQTPIYTKSGVKFVSVENINDLYSSDKYISVDDYNSDFKYVPEINDILMTRIGDIGTPALVTKSEPLAYYVSLALLKEIDLEPHFLYHYIQTAPFQKELWRRTLHVAFPKKINKNEIGDCAIFYPSTRCEQKKIALFLDGIEKRIKIQNKIISKYETLIKGISYYIIKKFNGKAYKLGTLAEIYQPQTITKTDLPDNGKYPVYGANGIIGYYDRFNHKESQIMITCRGSTCGTVNLSTPFSWITGNSMVINIDEHKSIVDKKYLYYYLKTQSFNDLISGSGQPQIVRKPLARLNVFLPEISQQIKLRKIIDTFEKTLKNEKEMLSALQKQKAFLLQTMFI